MSVIAQRNVCDYVNSVGGLFTVHLDAPLFEETRSARHKYDQYLEQQRQMKKSAEDENTNLMKAESQNLLFHTDHSDK